MSGDKRRAERDRLFGIPASRPEWQQRQDDARMKEREKTQALRAARLGNGPDQRRRHVPVGEQPGRKLDMIEPQVRLLQGAKLGAVGDRLADQRRIEPAQLAEQHQHAEVLQ